MSIIFLWILLIAILLACNEVIFTCRYFPLELNIFSNGHYFRTEWFVLFPQFFPLPHDVLFGITVNSQKSCKYKNNTKNTPCTLYLDSPISNILLHLLYHLFSFSVSIMGVCILIFEGHTNALALYP